MNRFLIPTRIATTWLTLAAPAQAQTAADLARLLSRGDTPTSISQTPTAPALTGATSLDLARLAAPAASHNTAPADGTAIAGAFSPATLAQATEPVVVATPSVLMAGK